MKKKAQANLKCGAQKSCGLKAWLQNQEDGGRASDKTQQITKRSNVRSEMFPSDGSSLNKIVEVPKTLKSVLLGNEKADVETYLYSKVVDVFSSSMMTLLQFSCFIYLSKVPLIEISGLITNCFSIFRKILKLSY